MQLNELTALAPVDGRYRSRTSLLAPFLSEWGLIRHRVEVEVEYFLALTQIPLPPLADFPSELAEPLRDVYRNFSEADADRIKALERVTNHDVKAVEYFLKEEMNRLGLGEVCEFVHFGLTSQDVNNTAIPLSLMRATHEVLLPSTYGTPCDAIGPGPRMEKHSHVGQNTWANGFSGHCGQGMGRVCRAIGHSVGDVPKH